MPHWGSRYEVMRFSTGTDSCILNEAKDGIIGCKETALLTIVFTSGNNPATADIMKLVDPWQWITALMESAPVCSLTFLTAAGWSYTAASSSVHELKRRSILARQFSSHTSYPRSARYSTSVHSTGARNKFARTPAP